MLNSIQFSIYSIILKCSSRIVVWIYNTFDKTLELKHLYEIFETDFMIVFTFLLQIIPTYAFA